MPGPRLSRKRSSAVELRAAYMRPLRGVSLWGETIYSNQPKMRQCLCKAVCGNVVGDIIRGGLGGIAGVAHGDADPGIFQHRHIAVKRDAVQRVQVRQVHRRAACGNNVLTPFSRSAASACTVDSGRALAWNGSSVPSISKNKSFLFIKNPFLYFAGPKVKHFIVQARMKFGTFDPDIILL